MKRIRIGKDLNCKLTVLTNGEAVSLEGDSIVLVMVHPNNSKKRIDYEGITDNVITFHVSPDMQSSTGVYGFEVWKNIGSGYQSVCDCVRAYELVALSIMEGGEDDADFGTDSADMETDFSNEYIVIDNLDSYLENAALSANMGRVLKEMIGGVDKATVKVADFITEKEVDEVIAAIVSGETKTFEEGRYLDGNVLAYLLKKVYDFIGEKKYLKVSPQTPIRWIGKHTIHYDVVSNTDWSVN